MQLPSYNPLDKTNLGASVCTALLQCPVGPLPPPQAFIAAGVYAIYYAGDFPAYESIAALNRDGKFGMPIYVGKAIPAGARRGGVGTDGSPGQALFSRLCEHAESVEEAQNLKLSDFYCRYLAVDDIWIPLGESLTIQRFMPVWNVLIDGYGNHDPGAGRYNQKRSSWDTIHPGRTWAGRCQPNTKSPEQVLKRLADWVAERAAAGHFLTPEARE